MQSEKRLIYADALKEVIEHLNWYSVRDGVLYPGATSFTGLFKARYIFAAIENAPTVNAVVLPCKIGDTVYYLATECDGCDEQDDYCHVSCKKPKGYTKVNKTVIKQFRILGNQFDGMTDTAALASTYSHDFYFRDIGKTVFLTSEEAEAALLRMNGKGETDV